MPQAESVRWLERQPQGHAEAEQAEPGGIFWRSGIGDSDSGVVNTVRCRHDTGTRGCLRRHIGRVTPTNPPTPAEQDAAAARLRNSKKKRLWRVLHRYLIPWILLLLINLKLTKQFWNTHTHTHDSCTRGTRGRPPDFFCGRHGISTSVGWLIRRVTSFVWW
jgi:hypothetical protein